MDFADGYGQWLERKDVCYSRYASLVVMITDTCPCYYPDNYASNKRWCCGDMYHLDLSVWAFEKVCGRSNCYLLTCKCRHGAPAFAHGFVERLTCWDIGT
jgi:hypothetical protein